MVLPYHSNLKTDDRPPIPGELAELDFAMFPASWPFRAGHRIRLSIVNSAGPAFKQPPGTELSSLPLIEMLRDRRHASSIELPTMPTG